MSNNTRVQQNFPNKQSQQKSVQNPTSTMAKCVGCRCVNCVQVKSDCQEIKKMSKEMNTKRIHEVSVTDTSAKSVNLCSQELPEEVELSKITHTKTLVDN